MDGGTTYVACPTVYSSTTAFPNTSACATGQYYTGSACAAYTYSSVQPFFGDMGLLGRLSTSGTAWSSTNLPKEAISYDPLPAECADITAHDCTSTYTGTKRYSVIDIIRLTNAGTTIYFDDGVTNVSTMLGLDSYNAHVQPGGSYGAYHYHGLPAWDDGTYANYIIGYSKDGFPIMGKGST